MLLDTSPIASALTGFILSPATFYPMALIFAFVLYLLFSLSKDQRDFDRSTFDCSILLITGIVVLTPVLSFNTIHLLGVTTHVAMSTASTYLSIASLIAFMSTPLWMLTLVQSDVLFNSVGLVKKFKIMFLVSSFSLVLCGSLIRILTLADAFLGFGIVLSGLTILVIMPIVLKLASKSSSTSLVIPDA